MGIVTILPETTTDPISLIGRRAGICWGADTTDPEQNYKRGMDCITSGHGRTLEYVNCEAVLSKWSARVIREWYTHIAGGPTRLQESTRYIDYTKDFQYVTPPSIKNAGEDAIRIYDNAIAHIVKSAKTIEEMGVPREDAALLYPLAMNTRIVDKRNLRSLMDMSRQRMCNRAYHEYRALFHTYINALSNYSQEWKTLIPLLMMPKCEAVGYCTEKKSCGRMPRNTNRKDKISE